MAKRNEAMGVQFNDNSGAEGFFYNSATLDDHHAMLKKLGVWRTRLRLIRLCWIAILGSERAIKLTRSAKDCAVCEPDRQEVSGG
jgi:hypothetical protein